MAELRIRSVPATLHNKAKIKAIKKGMSLNKLIIEAIKAYLKVKR